MREGLTALCHAKTMGTCLKNIPKLHRTLYLIIWALKSMSPVRFSHIAYGSNRQPHYFPKNTTKGAPFENDKTSFAVSILPKKAYDPLNINSTTPPSCCPMPNGFGHSSNTYVVSIWICTFSLAHGFCFLHRSNQLNTPLGTTIIQRPQVLKRENPSTNEQMSPSSCIFGLQSSAQTLKLLSP